MSETVLKPSFSCSHYVFQDFAMSRTIEIVKEQVGLYCLKNLER